MLSVIAGIGKTADIGAHPARAIRVRGRPQPVPEEPVVTPPEVVIKAAGEGVRIGLAQDGRREETDVRRAVQQLALHAPHRVPVDGMPDAGSAPVHAVSAP